MSSREAGWLSPRLCVNPIVDVLFDLIFRDTVPLLNFPLELITAARDLVQVVVGQVAPPLLDLAFQLFPVSLDSIPVHDLSPCVITTRT